MRVLWVSAVIVLIDQAAKATVLRLMHRGESIPVVGEWLRLTFTENPGMAFGITAGPRQMMTVFSIVVTVLVLWYLYSVRSGYTPYLVGLALILGGAVGNIIDRVFYGRLLGYGDFFTGKVVDFIHVDLWRGYLPNALPVVGGHYTALFPIWNVSDMAIVVGVVCILFFQRRFHQRAFEDGTLERSAVSEAASSRVASSRVASSRVASSEAGPADATSSETAPAPGAVPPQAPSAENPAGAPREAAGYDEAGAAGTSENGRSEGDPSRYAPSAPADRSTDE